MGLGGLNESGFEEGSIGASLFHGAYASSRDFNIQKFIYFRHENSLLLKIEVLADFAGRIEFSGTGPVRISAAHDRTFLCYLACFHM